VVPSDADWGYYYFKEKIRGILLKKESRLQRVVQDTQGPIFEKLEFGQRLFE
jgi:hypothetical protein